MSVSSRNKMLQILHQRGIVRNHIDRIIKDLEKDNIFDDFPVEDYDGEIDKTISSTEEQEKSDLIYGQIKTSKKQITHVNEKEKEIRSILHEAILMKDIWLARKLIKENKYNDVKDNNGHTPKEMAYYEDCQEILILFEIFEGEQK